jgi:hypothetical protein
MDMSMLNDNHIPGKHEITYQQTKLNGPNRLKNHKYPKRFGAVVVDHPLRK